MITTAIRKLPELNKLSSSQLHKIIEFNNLETFLRNYDDEKIVQCHGVFDLLHIGHIKHLQQAKSHGDILIVSITPDRFVNKGPGKPYFNERLRAEALAALDCVDHVVINEFPTAVEIVNIIRPNRYVKGIEYANPDNDITKKISEEEAAVLSCGGEIIFTEDIVFSSSALLNRFFSPFGPEVIAYIDQLKSQYKINTILNYFEEIQNLKVLVIGEAIIDIYHYGEAIGKSGKEPILVTKYNREEIYIGGILAIANHLSSFCQEVKCITVLGEKGQYESFINEKLKDNIENLPIYKNGAPTIVKRRYIEEYSGQKLFEIYEIEDCYLQDEQKNAFLDKINEEISKYDVVLVADYGHGLLDSEAISLIEEKAKFLAVNTQANASNHGFNCISKYKKADYVCIANRELQLNYRQKHISVLEQMKRLKSEYSYKNVMVTNGVKGAYFSDDTPNIHSIPAFATSVKDKVGAGDAVLAITSLLVANKVPSEVVGFIGNVVGSEAVNIMGNKSFIEKIALMKHILHLMK